MIPFQTGVDITNIDGLFGREEQIESLKNIAIRHENAGLIGTRRFGKTCLFKSMEVLLKQLECDVFPVYFDAKSIDAHNDSDAVYRYMTSLIISKLCNNSILAEGEEIKLGRHCSIEVSEDVLDIEEQLSRLTSERQRNSLAVIAEIIVSKGKYLILMIDEVEHLLLSALSSPKDFFRVRKLSDGDTLKFWVSGTASWSYITSTIGSSELNCGLTPILLTPLTKTQFDELWDCECGLIADETLKFKLLGLREFAFDKSGGVPFYAKEIGRWYCVHTNETHELDYSFLRDFFNEIWRNRFLSDTDKELLVTLSNGKRCYSDTAPDDLQFLCDRGLICQNGNEYYIGIGFLKDYILATYHSDEVEADNIMTITDEPQEHIIAWSPSSNVDQIISLRKRINQLWKEEQLYSKVLIRGDYPPFEASVDDDEDITVLRQVCTNKREFTAFGESMYHIFYEGTHKGANLPPSFAPFIRIGKFKAGISDSVSEFAQIAKVCRHAVAHRDYVRDNPIDISVETLLQKINNGDYITNDNCANVQKTILEMCLQYMNDMLSYLQSLL